MEEYRKIQIMLALTQTHALTHTLIKQALLWIKTPGGVDRNTRVASLYFKPEEQHSAA